MYAYLYTMTIWYFFHSSWEWNDVLLCPFAIRWFFHHKTSKQSKQLFQSVIEKKSSILSKWNIEMNTSTHPSRPTHKISNKIHLQTAWKQNKDSLLLRQFELDGEISNMFHLQPFKLEMIQFDEHILVLGVKLLEINSNWFSRHLIRLYFLWVFWIPPMIWESATPILDLHVEAIEPSQGVVFFQNECMSLLFVFFSFKGQI